MRTMVLAVAATLLASPATAQTTAWANKLFEETKHDFGTVPRGAQLKYTFKMKNIYKVPLEITGTRAGCGCLTHTVVKQVLQPNETGTIEVNMNTRLFSGFKSVKLHVTVGPEYISTAELIVSANARPDVVFNPGEVNFGLVSRGQAPTRVLDVEYAGALDWRITEVVKSAAAPFDLKVEEFQREGSQIRKVGYKFKLTLKPDAAAGPFRQDLILKTNDPASPILTVAVAGNVQATLSVAPNPVRLGSVKKGDMQTKKLVVRASRPFRILGVDGTGGGITADVPDHAAESHILTLHCRPDQPGDLRRQLLIRTDLERESVGVTVEATVLPK